jgi:hypothetical protein
VGAAEAVGEEEDATKHFEMVLYDRHTKLETAGCYRMDLEDRDRQLIRAICLFLFTQIRVLF